MTYRQLVDAIDQLRLQLAARGIMSNSRVAVVAPDSPETALLTVGLMSSCAVAPINPRLPLPELVRTFRLLKVQAVVAHRDVLPSVQPAADDAQIPLIGFSPLTTAPAGSFEITSPAADRDCRTCDPPQGSDLILLMQTSGTTASPKIVPLAHRNLLPLMYANIEALSLGASDRTLGLVPLFHIAGLGAVISTLLSGGSIAPLRGFSAESFFEMLGKIRPTWFTAVPTMHLAILDHLPKHAHLVNEIATNRELRFVRSGAAPMSPAVAAELERIWNTVYVEASGATEVGAYTSSNTPSWRKIGSVGRPLSCVQVAILDEQLRPVPPNTEGEIAIRSPGVFDGYEDNPAANAEAFHNGYFRSGDLGYLDKDGFLYICGRLKEQVNRAGMKICPKRIDDVLMQHPKVREAVAFGFPHPRVGEELAVAVVTRPGSSATELELQRYCAERLADYLVPRRVLFVDSIPRGPTGKIQRLQLHTQLAERLASTAAETGNPERTENWRAVAEVWAQVLGLNSVDPDCTFQELGGDSMQATEMCVLLEKRFGRRIPLAALFTHGTARKLANLLEADGWKASPGAPVRLRDGSGDCAPLFVMPGVGGNVYSYHNLVEHLPEHQPVVGLPLPGTDGLEAPMDSVDAIADRFLRFIRSEQPAGPYFLAGYSFGGRIAFEVAGRLADLGEELGLVALLDTPGPGWPTPLQLPARIGTHIRRLSRLRLKDVPGYIRGRIRRRTQMLPEEIARQLDLSGVAPERREEQSRLLAASDRAAKTHAPVRGSVPITLLRARQQIWKDSDVSDPTMGWSRWSTVPVRVLEVPGSHGTIFHPPNVESVARVLKQFLPAPGVLRLGMYRATA